MYKDKVKKCLLKFDGKFQFYAIFEAFVAEKILLSFHWNFIWGKKQRVIVSIAAMKPFCFF